VAEVTFSGVGKVYPDGHRAVQDLDLEISDGEFMVLVGPSGCGKTTALRMVAGLEEITEGELRIGDVVVNTVEPRKRDVAMVFQNYALYPHMTIFENIAFPLRSRRLPSEQVRADVERVAGMLGLTDMLKRRPRTLSGGQRQRVAMGRALVRQPQVFLMDEPLSNLDAKLRVQMRAEISKLQRELGVTTIYVTHDQVEALTMGSRIAVMRKGLLQQQGPPQELYDNPTNLFVATFIGSPSMNLFRSRLEQQGDGLACVVGDQRLVLPPRIADPRGVLAPYVGSDVALGIRPEHLSGVDASNNGVPRLRGQVQLVEALGSERLVHVNVNADPVLTEDVLEIARDTDAAVVQILEHEAVTQEVTVVARFDVTAAVEIGTETELAVSVAHLHVFDLETGVAVR
jgi:multiple sugar transport system ATP-binding protein